MVHFKTVLHYLWRTGGFMYLLGTKFSLRTWFYLFVAAVALIGAYCIMHIMCDLWKTIGAIIMFAPKLYIKFISYLMSYVDGPRCLYYRRPHHHRHHHHHHHQRTPPQSNEER